MFKNLPSTFIFEINSLLSKDKKFNRIFTSVLENQELNSSSSILLRSDITGQVINTILSHDFKKKHYL
mgnify:CR=1 FL=1